MLPGRRPVTLRRMTPSRDSKGSSGSNAPEFLFGLGSPGNGKGVWRMARSPVPPSGYKLDKDFDHKDLDEAVDYSEKDLFKDLEPHLSFLRENYLSLVEKKKSKDEDKFVKRIKENFATMVEDLAVQDASFSEAPAEFESSCSERSHGAFQAQHGHKSTTQDIPEFRDNQDDVTLGRLNLDNENPPDRQSKHVLGKKEEEAQEEKRKMSERYVSSFGDFSKSVSEWHSINGTEKMYGEDSESNTTQTAENTTSFAALTPFGDSGTCGFRDSPLDEPMPRGTEEENTFESSQIRRKNIKGAPKEDGERRNETENKGSDTNTFSFGDQLELTSEWSSNYGKVAPNTGNSENEKFAAEQVDGGLKFGDGGEECLSGFGDFSLDKPLTQDGTVDNAFEKASGIKFNQKNENDRENKIPLSIATSKGDPTTCDAKFSKFERNTNDDDGIDDNENFTPSETFCGERKGYAFYVGPQGLGYYKDKWQSGAPIEDGDFESENPRSNLKEASVEKVPSSFGFDEEDPVTSGFENFSLENAPGKASVVKIPGSSVSGEDVATSGLENFPSGPPDMTEEKQNLNFDSFSDKEPKKEAPRLATGSSEVKNNIQAKENPVDKYQNSSEFSSKSVTKTTAVKPCSGSKTDNSLPKNPKDTIAGSGIGAEPECEQQRHTNDNNLNGKDVSEFLSSIRLDQYAEKIVKDMNVCSLRDLHQNAESIIEQVQMKKGHAQKLRTYLEKLEFSRNDTDFRSPNQVSSESALKLDSENKGKLGNTADATVSGFLVNDQINAETGFANPPLPTFGDASDTLESWEESFQDNKAQISNIERTFGSGLGNSEEFMSFGSFGKNNALLTEEKNAESKGSGSGALGGENQAVSWTLSSTSKSNSQNLDWGPNDSDRKNNQTGLAWGADTGQGFEANDNQYFSSGFSATPDANGFEGCRSVTSGLGDEGSSFGGSGLGSGWGSDSGRWGFGSGIADLAGAGAGAGSGWGSDSGRWGFGSGIADLAGAGAGAGAGFEGLAGAGIGDLAGSGFRSGSGLNGNSNSGSKESSGFRASGEQSSALVNFGQASFGFGGEQKTDSDNMFPGWGTGFNDVQGFENGQNSSTGLGNDSFTTFRSTPDDDDFD